MGWVYQHILMNQSMETAQVWWGGPAPRPRADWQLDPPGSEPALSRKIPSRSRSRGHLWLGFPTELGQFPYIGVMGAMPPAVGMGPRSLRVMRISTRAQALDVIM